MARLILVPWRRYAPEARREALEALLSREDWTAAYLEAAVAEEVSAAEVEPARRGLLRKHSSERVRALAERVFGPDASSPRSLVLLAYRPALTLRGDSARGAAVFERTCQGCHEVGGKGHAVGPSLASSPAKDPEAVLASVLDPNSYVPPSYVQYVAVDRRGRTLVGMISAQTSTSVTLKREGDVAETVLRSDLRELSSTGLSLMPEGLERSIDVPAMADLLAFLEQAMAASGASTPDRERDFGTLPGLVEPAGKTGRR